MLSNARSATTAAKPAYRASDAFVAGSILGPHIVEHVYARGFVIIIPAIYAALGLAPIQAGVIEAVRSASSGLTSMVSGPFVDVFQHRRSLIMGFSLATLGLGYFLVGISPSYGLILAALVLASAGSALWHPPALGLLSQRFPERRGLFLALHRSSGNVGESAGALLAGALLLMLAWQRVVQIGFPLAIFLAILVALSLRGVDAARPQTLHLGLKLREHFGKMRQALRGFGLWNVLLVSGIAGMGDRTIFLFLPLYLSQKLGMNSWFIGVHVALLTALGIVAGPIIGGVSDRLGRRPVIFGVMALSALFPLGMVLTGGGAGLTASVALMGIFMFSVNSLTQAAAMDIVQGRQLEGSFIGLQWGNNIAFGAISPIVAGALAGIFGLEAAFYFASSIFVLGALVSLTCPPLRSRR